MAILRTQQLARGAITGTAVTNVYTVPTGKLIILKSVQLLEATGVATGVQLRDNVAGTWGLVNLTAYSSSGSSVETLMWNAFPAGTILQLARLNSGTIGYILSGSLLYV